MIPCPAGKPTMGVIQRVESVEIGEIHGCQGSFLGPQDLGSVHGVLGGWVYHIKV